jgi:putative inorganic carbon (hco3(-)) transporter
MNSTAVLGAGIMLGAILAVAGLFRPFLGLLVFIVIHFVQPGELIPALAPLRIELVYGALLTTAVFLRQFSILGLSFLNDKILFGAVLLVISALLSVPFAVWRGGALTTVLDVVKLVILIFLLIAVVDSKGRLRKILWCMTLVAVWFAASSLFAYVHGHFYTLKDLERVEGVNSIVGGPNELAAVLLAFFPLLIVLLRTTRNTLLRIFLVACGIVILSAISLTGSRIAMIGLIVMVIYYLVQSKHKVSTLAVCLFIGGFIWQSLPSEYKTRYLTVGQYAGGSQLDASNELRLQIWKAGGKIFLEHPILGVGAGQFSTAYGLMYLETGKHRAWMNPHNLLIQVACELGVVGVSIFLYFIWQIAKGIRFVLQRKRGRPSDLNYQMAIACSAMYLGVVILSLVGHTLYRPHWYLLAGLVAANRNIVTAWLKASEGIKGAAVAPQDEPTQELDSIARPASTISKGTSPASWICRTSRVFDSPP